MKTLPLTMALAILASGCAAGSLPVTTMNELTVDFICDDGESLTVRFNQVAGWAVLMRGDSSIDLQRQPSVAGFIYSDARQTIRGELDQMTVEIDRMAPLECTAQ